MSRFEKRQARPKGVGPKTPDEQDLITASLVGLDAVSVEMERRWGVGRLVTLCRDNARLSFRKGWTAWQEAIARGDAQTAQGIVEGIKRCWAIMDAQAVADGHQPLSPEVWEARLDDGRVLAIARTNAEAIAVQREGRATIAYSLAEIARLLPKLEMMDAVKTEFHGATVEQVIQKTEGFAESWATTDPLHDMLYQEEAV